MADELTAIYDLWRLLLPGAVQMSDDIASSYSVLLGGAAQDALQGAGSEFGHGRCDAQLATDDVSKKIETNSNNCRVSDEIAVLKSSSAQSVQDGRVFRSLSDRMVDQPKAILSERNHGSVRRHASVSSNAGHKLRLSTIKKGEYGKATNCEMTWGNLIERLKRVSIDQEHTQAQYLALDKNAQTAAKDVGSYVLGQFDNNRRKRESIKSRSGVALDIDSLTLDQIDEFKLGISDLWEYEFFATTSRSHTPMAPKWRIIFPSVKMIPAEHFGAVSRILSSKLLANPEDSMNAIDEVTHRVAQVMFFPSRSRDSAFEHFHNTGKLLDHEALLASYDGWEDYTKLPHSPKRGPTRPGQLGPAERPNEKTNFVGAFCRAYTVTKAISAFLPDVYVDPRKEGRDFRYTYARGHGAKGAVVYDGDLFLYSYHGTDPCGTRLVNAFDMVRLHLYGDQDKGDDDGGLSASKQPSFKAMHGRFASDPAVYRETQKMTDKRVDAIPSKFNVLDDASGEAPTVPTQRLAPKAPAAATPSSDPLLNPEMVEDDPLLGPALVAAAGEHDDLLGPAPGTPTVPARIEDHPDFDPLTGELKPSPGVVRADAGEDEDAPEYVKAFNREQAIVIIGGKTRVARLDTDQRTYEFMPREEFFAFHIADKVPKPNSNVMWPRAEAWFNHELADRCDGVVFDPKYKPNPRARYKKLNLWTGFAIDPDPTASCELFLRHLREVCTSTTEEYDYLIGWLAHMVQKPEEIPAIAVIFQGAKGTGKDTLGEYMSPFLGKMHVNLGKQGALYTNFNKHFENCLFMQLQEAFWAGDKKNEGNLKSIITSTTHFIEPKGLDGYKVKSLLRLFMTSNEDWVVPATSDERRYFILKMKNTHRQDIKGWFDPIYRERDNGGAAAFLHFLMTYDLTGFQVRTPPDTEALRLQKDMGYRGVEGWWINCLSEGNLPGLDALDDGGMSSKERWERSTPRIPTSQLYASYENWSKSRRSEYQPMDQRFFGRKLKELCSGIERLKVRKGPVEFDHVYSIPTLALARAQWDEKSNFVREWDSDRDLTAEEVVDDQADALA